MTMNAYDKIYLEDATETFGAMVDCGVNTLGCPSGEFWSRFLASSISDRFSHGAADIIAGHSGVELALMVMRETGHELYECNPQVSISSREYWAGMSLARYQWETALSFQELSRHGLGLVETIMMFNPLHEADPTVFSTVAGEIVGANINSNGWLKQMRRINAMTQEELSIRSGVPIRLVRAYEQGTIDTENAEYRNIIRLRQALGAYSL